MADCVIALADARSIDLSEAQRIVVESDVWADRRAAYLELERSFWEAAEKLGDRRPDGSIKIDLRALGE